MKSDIFASKLWGALAALSLLLVSVSAQGDDRLTAIASGEGPNSKLSGLQVSLMRDGKPEAHFSYGFARLSDGEPTPLTNAHKIRIASISKMVMAIGFMQLVEQSKLNLDSDVSETLGWQLRNSAFPDTPITARQLLAHTSSVRDGGRYWLPAAQNIQDFFTPGTELYDDGGHFSSAPGQEPGEYFNYSNLNFGILGSLMEKASGERFDRYMKTRVLEPMGLSASYNPCDIPDDLRAAAFRKRGPNGEWNPDGDWYDQVDGGEPVCFYGMHADGGPAVSEFEASYELGSNGTLFSPQGGLRASTDDLLIIMQMMVNMGMHGDKQILSEASITEMLTPVWTYDPATGNGNTTGEGEPGGPTEGLMTSYGLSVHRVSLDEWGLSETPKLLVGHLGEAYGVLSHALYDPETGNGIATIITGTTDDPAKAPAGSSPLYRVEEEIVRWWLEQQ